MISLRLLHTKKKWASKQLTSREGGHQTQAGTGRAAAADRQMQVTIAVTGRSYWEGSVAIKAFETGVPLFGFPPFLPLFINRMHGLLFLLLLLLFVCGLLGMGILGRVSFY